MSAGATGSLTTSAHPAARKNGSRTERTATIATTANATITRIGTQLSRLERMLKFIVFICTKAFRVHYLALLPNPITHWLALMTVLSPNARLHGSQRCNGPIFHHQHALPSIVELCGRQRKVLPARYHSTVPDCFCTCPAPLEPPAVSVPTRGSSLN